MAGSGWLRDSGNRLHCQDGLKLLRADQRAPQRAPFFVLPELNPGTGLADYAPLLHWAPVACWSVAGAGLLVIAASRLHGGDGAQAV